jgi:hypothetical protein
MKKNSNIFQDDIKVPEIVLQKADEAFAGIQTEGRSTMKKNNQTENRKHTFWRNPAAVAACTCIIVAGSVTAGAAVHHVWSRGMQGAVQATDTQQKELTDKGAAVVLKEQKDYSKLAVTDNGITITPETVIVDDYFAHVAFSVKGYDLAEGEEPGFDIWNMGLKDVKKATNAQAYGKFYDGIVSDENGQPVYEDGSSLKEDEQGQIISHYVDEDGNLEYVASIGVADWKDSLLGKTIVCKLKDLGTLYKTRFTLAKEGNWDFEIKLPDVSTASNIKVAKGIENTPFTVDDVELSPISIKINYSVNGEVTFKEDTNQVPQFLGVILKDGKKISFLGDAGGTGYNEAMTEAYTLSSFVQVIEPDQVQAIILRNDDGEQIEIPIR